MKKNKVKKVYCENCKHLIDLLSMGFTSCLSLGFGCNCEAHKLKSDSITYNWLSEKRTFVFALPNKYNKKNNCKYFEEEEKGV